jgi:hypothetical protein
MEMPGMRWLFCNESMYFSAAPIAFLYDLSRITSFHVPGCAKMQKEQNSKVVVKIIFMAKCI